ncbi:MAG: HAD family hydrolase [Methanomassiliicoccus sp.]|nr:HAD family hydrolase [Methanomassiliicoccus sp.]
MPVRTVLVDLGGTLVDLFGHTSPGQVLPLSLASAARALVLEGHDVPPQNVLERSWEGQKRVPDDLEVRPLEARLSAVFGPDAIDDRTMDAACRAFMRPLFDQARVFEDTFPFLSALRSRGIEAVIVSNTTWGSPAILWREAVERMAIRPWVRSVVFCRDVGWRKPDPRVFSHALSMADRGPEECLFVGDDPVWDVMGPQRVGIRAVLLDRRAERIGQGFDRVTNLREITDHI